MPMGTGTLVSSQVLVFFYSCFLGAALGVAYDVIRIFRRAIPHNYAVIGIEDFAFFVLVALQSFRFMIGVLDGRVRCFIVIGEILGWVLYFFTISIVIMGISEQIIRFVKAILRLFGKYILYPIFYVIRKIIGILMIPFVFMGKKAESAAKDAGREIKTRAKKLKNPLKRRSKLLYNKVKNKLRRFYQKLSR